METKAFRCNGCGAPLPVKKEKDGVVTCEYCGTKNHVEGIEKDETPVYSAPAKTGKELIGRFMDMKEEKQANLTLNLIMIIFFVGCFLALMVGAICGAI